MTIAGTARQVEDPRMTPARAMERYLAELGRQGRKPTTLHNYSRYIGELAELYPYIEIHELSSDQWRKWLDRICTATRKDKVKLDTETVSQRITIAKQFTKWLRLEELIEKDPLERITPPRRKNPVENDNIVWITPEETARMLAVAERDMLTQRNPQDRYRKILCLGVLSYTGGRRSAVSRLRIRDYDAVSEPPTLTFREKGGKIIKKPVARRLAEIIREADLAGVWTDPSDYLIPGMASTRGTERSSKIIYRLVKEIAADAGIDAHVHSLRAAFACYFEESNPGQVLALKDLLGHSNIETTLTYLRRRNRQKGMSSVVDLDWGEPTFEAFRVAEKEGFEPSIPPLEPNKPSSSIRRGT